MKKTIFIGLILSMAIGFVFTNFTAPQTTGTISGTVYDALTHKVLEGILIEEVTSTGVLNSERTNVSGKFSISVSNSPSDLRITTNTEPRPSVLIGKTQIAAMSQSI